MINTIHPKINTVFRTEMLSSNEIVCGPFLQWECIWYIIAQTATVLAMIRVKTNRHGKCDDIFEFPKVSKSYYPIGRMDVKPWIHTDVRISPACTHFSVRLYQNCPRIVTRLHRRQKTHRVCNHDDVIWKRFSHCWPLSLISPPSRASNADLFFFFLFAWITVEKTPQESYRWFESTYQWYTNMYIYNGKIAKISLLCLQNNFDDTRDSIKKVLLFKTNLRRPCRNSTSIWQLPWSHLRYRQSFQRSSHVGSVADIACVT